MTLLGILSIISAIVCFDMANRRAKSGVAWAIGGLFFPILAPLILVASGQGPRDKYIADHEAQRMKELEEALGAKDEGEAPAEDEASGR